MFSSCSIQFPSLLSVRPVWYQFFFFTICLSFLFIPCMLGSKYYNFVEFITLKISETTKYRSAVLTVIQLIQKWPVTQFQLFSQNKLCQLIKTVADNLWLTVIWSSVSTWHSLSNAHRPMFISSVTKCTYAYFESLSTGIKKVICIYWQEPLVLLRRQVCLVEGLSLSLSLDT